MKNQSDELIIADEHGGDGVSLYIDKDGEYYLNYWWDSECVGSDEVLDYQTRKKIIEFLRGHI